MNMFIYSARLSFYSMKGKQRWHTTAATSPSALELLAQEENERLLPKFHVRRPKKGKPYNVGEEPDFWINYSKQVAKNSKESRSLHDHYVQKVLEVMIGDTCYVELEDGLQYKENGYEGEFDVYARGLYNQHTCVEVKVYRSEENAEKAIKQFVRAINAFPDRNWMFYLVTPAPNDGYYSEPCTDEAYRRQKEEALAERKKKHVKPKTHKRNHRRRH